jgi:hypothetical protein
MDNNTDSSSAYGVKPMVVPAPPSGSNGSIQQNNTAITQQNTQRQMAARFGGSRKILRGGLVVPPVQISYKETGVGNTNTSNNITASAKTTADLTASAEFDKEVAPVQKAGRKSRSKGRSKSRSKSRKLTGGWPEWGCMSGGRKSRKCRCKSCRSRRKNSHRRRKSK